jgi:cobyrinic acid a,c-diamide synthase
MKAFVLAGTHSGCGKTTLTAGLIRALRHRGEVVAPFKAGPDYLDPQLHAVAAARRCWNLDGWFMEDAALQEALHRGGEGATLSVVEGVMGLFDGSDPVSFQGSTADLSRRMNVPVVLVVDASAVGGSIAATVLGHQALWPDLQVAGVIFNRVGSESHFQMLRSAVEAHTQVQVIGWAKRSSSWRLPERHLGIHRPADLPHLEEALDALAEELAETLDLDRLMALASTPTLPSVLASKSGELPVALAWDEAFSFAYADTLDRMERLGVRWVPFSPLRERVPEGIAGIYLPGGYPELHAETLASNAALHADLRIAKAIGLPIYAECGGLMLLSEALVDLQGRSHPMAGLLQGRTRMTERLQNFGYKRITAQRDLLFGARGIEGKAHEFHHSAWEGPLPQPAYEAVPLRGEGRLEGYADGSLVATYCHVHFAAQPTWAEAWVQRMRTYASVAK